MINSKRLVRFLPYLTLIAIVAIVVGCSTTKSRDDLSALGMAYQNTTARYNGYFNATEIMKESHATLESEHQDNYNQLLPVFEYNAVADPKSVAGDMDEVIKKSSVVISLHRPSKWTDDCYLLIGQAQYLKQDYESAQKTLEYMVNNFDETGKSTAKVKEKPSKAQTKAERIRRIQEKNKEIQARRKQAMKERAEKNKEIEAEKKERQKTRKQEKKQREKTNKSNKKEREKASKERLKKRKQANKEAAKRRKNAKKRKSSSRKKPAPKSKSKSDVSDVKKEEKTSPSPVKKTETKPAKKVEKEDDKKEAQEEEEKEQKKKKDKKKEEKAKDGALAHKPAKPRGQLWLAKTYVERDFLTQADRLFKQAEAGAEGDKVLLEELYPSMADFYIYTENYQAAIPALEKAIDHTKRKALKARYAYIIGQLNAMLGNNTAAMAYFDKAASWSRDYEMEFNARLNEKLASLSGGSKSGERVAKELERLLKDEKNKDFKDQIYFQIAKVYLEEGNQPKAEEYLNLALENATTPAQKGEIHYALGNIHYDKDAFDIAYEHYNQALAAMDKSDMRVKALKARTEDIKLIAANLKELNLQDSLLMLAGLSDDELKARAQVILDNRASAKEAAAEKMAAISGKPSNRTTALPSTVSPVATAGGFESNFFAYNERELRKGEREFARVWGSRPLVDDWRRNETGDLLDDVEEDNTESSAKSGGAITSSELESVFSGLPRSDEEVSQANVTIANALYNLGMGYRNNLERLDLSSEAFDRFVNDHPNDSRVPEALYFLFLNAKDQGNTALAQTYADRLNKDFPGTKYALLAADPAYVNTLNDDGNSIEAFYNATYEAFNKGDYDVVDKAFSKARDTYGTENDFIAKFALLQAMSVGKLQGKEQYIEALRTVVAQYPNTPEQIRAREIIRFLGGDESAFDNSSQQSAIKISNFKIENDKLHYVIVVIQNKEVVSTNDVKIAINKYNNLFHKLDKLSIRSTIVDRGAAKTPGVLIRKFDDKADAMSYYNEVLGRQKEFLPAKTDADIFAISQHNYREMIKSGGTEGYKTFFQNNYLRE